MAPGFPWRPSVAGTAAFTALVVFAAIVVLPRGNPPPRGRGQDALRSDGAATITTAMPETDGENNASAPVVSSETPSDVARRLQSLARRRAYDQIAAQLTGPNSADAVRFLRAIDTVRDANRRFCEASAAAYSVSFLEPRDLDAIRNCRGLFSDDVTLIGEQYRGDQATVVLQEGDNVPLIRAEFVLRKGRWLLRPEATAPELISSLETLADVLRDVAGQVAAGMDFQTYGDAVCRHVLPQILRTARAGGRTPILAEAAPED